MELTADERVVLAAIEKWMPGCTWVNLLREMPPALRAEATQLVWSSANVAIWPEPVNKRIVDALCSLETRGLIEMRGTPALTYQLDGVAFNMPVANSLHEDDGGNVAKWYPVAYFLVQ